MTTANLSNYRKEVIEATQQLVATGIMTKSLHGNLSMRVPGQDAYLLTAGGSLASMQPENIALFALDGSLIEGTVQPVGAEIIQMHGIVYRKKSEVQSVVHTHSPFATGFAVAGKSIPGAYEALVRNGMVDGVPLAGYAVPTSRSTTLPPCSTSTTPSRACFSKTMVCSPSRSPWVVPSGRT